jgi:hypothetical protein
MKSNAHQSIAVNVPAWLGKACDDRRIFNLSDTRTYRLLLSIFQAVVSSAVTTSGIDGSLEDEMHPDGHFKFPHLWPVKFPQAGRLNYQLFGLAGSGFLSW